VTVAALQVADFSMAPLTINYGREMAIDFTKPFMTFGVSILYRRPQKDPPGLLSFLAPISYEVWATVLSECCANFSADLSLITLIATFF